MTSTEEWKYGRIGDCIAREKINEGIPSSSRMGEPSLPLKETVTHRSVASLDE